jgi:hypothetical protein
MFFLKRGFGIGFPCNLHEKARLSLNRMCFALASHNCNTRERERERETTRGKMTYFGMFVHGKELS